MKALKIFNIACFIVSVVVASVFADKADNKVRPDSIGWLILAAANVLSYTWIAIEENRSK
jgi:hypothetical protein